jgi:hypothetical protein
MPLKIHAAMQNAHNLHAVSCQSIEKHMSADLKFEISRTNLATSATTLWRGGQSPRPMQ